MNYTGENSSQCPHTAFPAGIRNAPSMPSASLHSQYLPATFPLKNKINQIPDELSQTMKQLLVLNTRKADVLGVLRESHAK